MARVVVQGIAGELSGKLGGDVFARNRAGAYVRKNANVVNPNTIAQIRARTAFAAASSQFHTLSAAQKTAWQNYADTRFVSKSGKVPGMLSNQNVFIAMRNAQLNLNAVIDPAVIIEEGSVACTFSQDPYLQRTPPPNDFPSAGISPSPGTVVNIGLRDVEVKGTTGVGVESVKFGIKDLDAPVTGPTTTVDDFAMPYGSQTIAGGFAVYMSNAMKQEGLFVNNPDEYLIASTGRISVLDNGGSAPVLGDLNIELNLNQIASNYQQLPDVSDAVQITVYQTDTYGCFRKLGSEIVTVTV